MSKNYYNMAIANDLLHRNEVVDYQENSLSKGGLVEKRNMELHVNLEIFCVSS